MGAWGIKGLESDTGLDVLDEFTDYCNNHSTIIIDELISHFKIEGLLAQDDIEIEYLYDHSIIVLAELIIDYHKDGKIVLEFSDEDDQEVTKDITDVTYSLEALVYIIDHLVDILEPSSEIHELYQLWQESESFMLWKEHLDTLIEKLEELKGI